MPVDEGRLFHHRLRAFLIITIAQQGLPLSVPSKDLMAMAETVYVHHVSSRLVCPVSSRLSCLVSYIYYDGSTSHLVSSLIFNTIE